MVRLVRLNRSGWAATGRLVGGRRSLTGAQWRGMRLQLSDLDAKLRLSELGRRRSKKLSPAQRKEIASLALGKSLARGALRADEEGCGGAQARAAQIEVVIAVYF